ncbi:MAG: type II toxin-antitoxin system VapC family toxin [Candidatus Korobacteraceae bacterium]
MIVDTSALIAILFLEPEARLFSDLIAQTVDCCISAANYLEAAIVLDAAHNPIVSRRLDELIRNADISVEPVTAAQAKIAREAYRDFGKGSGHPAQLNFGDCFAYALARDRGEPLLFKGNDFSQTDISSASD